MHTHAHLWAQATHVIDFIYLTGDVRGGSNQHFSNCPPSPTFPGVSSGNFTKDSLLQWPAPGSSGFLLHPGTEPIP